MRITSSRVDNRIKSLTIFGVTFANKTLTAGMSNVCYLVSPPVGSMCTTLLTTTWQKLSKANILWQCDEALYVFSRDLSTFIIAEDTKRLWITSRGLDFYPWKVFEFFMGNGWNVDFPKMIFFPWRNVDPSDRH